MNISLDVFELMVDLRRPCWNTYEKGMDERSAVGKERRRSHRLALKGCR